MRRIIKCSSQSLKSEMLDMLKNRESYDEYILNKDNTKFRYCSYEEDYVWFGSVDELFSLFKKYVEDGENKEDALFEYALAEVTRHHEAACSYASDVPDMIAEANHYTKKYGFPEDSLLEEEYYEDDDEEDW